MRSVSLRVRFEDGTIHPMHAFVAEDDRYGPTRLLQWAVTSRDTALMVFHVTGPAGPYTDALDATPNVLDYESVTATGDDQFVVFVEDAVTENAGILQGYEDENVVSVPPVVFNTDRSADINLVGPNDALQEVIERVPEGVDAEIRRVGRGQRPGVGPSAALTSTQRRVLVTATRLGYYDEPRSATLEDVASELGLASGTVAEHVRKAEAALVERALGDLG